MPSSSTNKRSSKWSWVFTCWSWFVSCCTVNNKQQDQEEPYMPRDKIRVESITVDPNYISASNEDRLATINPKEVQLIDEQPSPTEAKSMTGSEPSHAKPDKKGGPSNAKSEQQTDPTNTKSEKQADTTCSTNSEKKDDSTNVKPEKEASSTNAKSIIKAIPTQESEKAVDSSNANPNNSKFEKVVNSIESGKEAGPINTKSKDQANQTNTMAEKQADPSSADSEKQADPTSVNSEKTANPTNDKPEKAANPTDAKSQKDTIPTEAKSDKEANPSIDATRKLSSVKFKKVANQSSGKPNSTDALNIQIQQIKTIVKYEKANPPSVSQIIQVHSTNNQPKISKTIRVLDLGKDVIRESKELGSGCQAKVFLARLAASGKPCVVKQFHVPTLDMWNEIHILSQLAGNEYFPKLYGIINQSRVSASGATVMEFVGDVDDKVSETLIDALDNDTLDALQWCNVAVSLCKGIRDLHLAGYLHCDLKEDNVIVHREQRTSTWRAKIIDFGFAKPIRVKSEPERLTEEEKAYYRENCAHIAPEIINGVTGPTEKSDIYSVGDTLVEIGTETGITAFVDWGKMCRDPDASCRPTLQWLIDRLEKLERMWTNQI